MIKYHNHLCVSYYSQIRRLLTFIEHLALLYNIIYYYMRSMLKYLLCIVLLLPLASSSQPVNSMDQLQVIDATGVPVFISESAGMDTSGDDARIRFVWSGRTERTFYHSGKLSGPGSAVEFDFMGETITLKLANNAYQGNHNYVAVELDSQYLGRFKIDNNEFRDFTFTASDKSKRIHTIKIVKATESAMGAVFVDASGVHALPREPVSKKKIEFIGNSITCGFGNDITGIPCGKAQWYDQHNAYLAYGPVVSRKLNTDYLLSSVSGYGIYRNWNAEKPEESTLPDVYDHLYLRTDQPAPFSNDYQPDLVSICLGTNDLSDGDGKKQRLPFSKEKFIENYVRFVERIWQKYPKTTIVLLNSPMVGGEKNKLFVECLQNIRDYFKNDRPHQPIHIFLFPQMKPTGCDYHPSAEEHQKMAELLYPFYQRLLNP